MKRIKWSCGPVDFGYRFSAKKGNVEMVQFVTSRELQELNRPTGLVARILGDMQKTMSEAGNHVE